MNPPQKPERRLSEGYYLDNFENVLESAAERYDDLLRPQEVAFLEDFRALPTAARRLYVRLVSRKGPAIRRDRLDYPEVGSIDAALAELEAAGFADRGSDAGVDELLSLLLRAELDAMAAELLEGAPPPAARKAELIALLLREVDGARLEGAARARLEIVRPLRGEQVLVFRLLFFGNLSQDWTEHVLRDLGVVRYETYEVRREQRRFPTREAVDHTLALSAARSAVKDCLAGGELALARELAAPVLAGAGSWHPAARRLADSIFLHVGRALERSGELRAALELYGGAVTPPARERTARILARLGSVGRALELCEEIGDAPRDESEVVFARAFAHRLRRMRGEPLRPRARRRRPTVHLTLERGDDGTAVERLALDALESAGRRGFFAENWLWRSLYGLAFWDVVFAPVGGAFQHPFQLGPMDLDSPGFRAARAEAVERRLQELAAEPAPGGALMAVYEAKRDVANRLVAWHPGLRGHLELALSRLTGRQLAWVFDRLSRDLGRYRRGFPDLFVLRDGAPGFELYEVKAPGDQLRPEQRAWIDYLNEGGLPAAILKVGW